MRMWEVARFNLVVRCGVLVPRNLIKTCMFALQCGYQYHINSIYIVVHIVG